MISRIWRWLPLWVRRMLLWHLSAHFIVGTVAVVRDDEDRVLLARHTYRRTYPWALPGGWMRKGEHPEGTAAREILEETGLDIEVLAPLAVWAEGPGHLTLIYTARLRGGTFKSSGEVSEVCFAAPGAWPEGLRPDHRALLEATGRHPAVHHAP